MLYFQRQHSGGALSLHGEGSAPVHGAALPDVLELQEARHSSGSAAHHRGNTPTALHRRGLQRPGDGVPLFAAGGFSQIVVDFNMFS